MAAEASELRRRELDHCEALERRLTHLRERLASWDPRRDANRTRAEASAAAWVLRLVDACEREGLFSDLRHRGYDV